MLLLPRAVPRTARLSTVLHPDRASLRPTRPRCEVADGHRERRPQLCPVSLRRESGRGMRLVDELALCWGSSPTPTGKDVWFEMPLS